MYAIRDCRPERNAQRSKPVSATVRAAMQGEANQPPPPYGPPSVARQAAHHRVPSLTTGESLGGYPPLQSSTHQRQSHAGSCGAGSHPEPQAEEGAGAYLRKTEMQVEKHKSPLDKVILNG